MIELNCIHYLSVPVCCLNFFIAFFVRSKMPDNTCHDQGHCIRILWNCNSDRIQEIILIGSYDPGGLKMPHIKSYFYALKIKWIHKLLLPFNLSSWKTFFNDKYSKFLADYTWMMNKDSFEQVFDGNSSKLDLEYFS